MAALMAAAALTEGGAGFVRAERNIGYEFDFPPSPAPAAGGRHKQRCQRDPKPRKNKAQRKARKANRK